MMIRRFIPLLLLLAIAPAIAQVHDLTTLMPRPKEAFAPRLAGNFTLAAGVPIYIVAADDRALTRSAAYLAAAVAGRGTFTPEIRTVASLEGLPTGPKVVIGILGDLGTAVSARHGRPLTCPGFACSDIRDQVHTTRVECTMSSLLQRQVCTLSP